MKRTNTKGLRAALPASQATVTFIGSGNVATHLALAMHSAGFTIGQVLSRDYDHAQLLASRVDAQPINRRELLRNDAEVYILAVGDDALLDLALDLKLPEALVLHTSGATTAEVLRPISRRYGVVWSPQTFVRDIAMDYSELPLCIEGCSPTVTGEIENLMRAVSHNVHRLTCEQRRWAHLSSVMVSNFVNAINALAQQTMQQHGLDFNILRPIAEQTLRKWDYGDLRTQQTGPAVRHDDSTIKLHRRLLADQPDLLKLYDLMTEIIQQ